MTDDRSNRASVADDDGPTAADDDEPAATAGNGGPPGTATGDYPVPHLLAGGLAVEKLDSFLGTVRTIREETGTVVQVVDARYVVSRTHLDRAVARAERAVDRDEAVASDRAVEVLLYAAGRRQIDEALEMGVEEGETAAIAVVYSPDAASPGTARSGDGTTSQADTTPHGVSQAIDRLAQRFDAVTIHPPGDREEVETWLADVTDSERVRSFHDVTETELEATLGTLADVVEERVALLDVEK
ncbi:KEOPS complex subunit Cgi121 [Halopenitus persicus]|uniref:KEOPS complex subunit Cgi121 n=1 Tax=Halopenitus persicus TaxID=1048396 RepID=A0A1H3FZB1_9EURY|nr:KEOPS complex subunit Cgi121 [Halopenitus persicus]SDX95449.1 KEOPS complex subunit Cgi121 [Halopenitus persicus]